MKSIRIIFIV